MAESKEEVSLTISINQHIAYIALVVNDYDEAIADTQHPTSYDLLTDTNYTNLLECIELTFQIL